MITPATHGLQLSLLPHDGVPARQKWTPNRYLSVEQRLWPRLVKGDGCWEWPGDRNTEGYGRICIGNQKRYTHRTAWELTNGPIPLGMFVCHRCDNPPCCNPEHLFLGTAIDNNRDMKEKGRAARGDASGMRKHPEKIPCGDRNGARTHPESILRGEGRWNAKLSEADVLMMRQRHRAGEASANIARELNINVGTVRDAVAGRTWSHI